MKITGPFKRADRAGTWFLRYSVPKLGPDGTPILKKDRAVLDRKRPSYATKAEAEADKPRIMAQFGAAGGGRFVESRKALAEYEQARAMLPAGISLIQVAAYYVRHHPNVAPISIEEARTKLIAHVESVTGKTRHAQDLAWRTSLFVRDFAGRVPASISRADVMQWLLALPGSPRSKLNHKRAVVRFFSFMLTNGLVDANPIAGVKRAELPRVLKKEVVFLPLDMVTAYLRAAERYDPELVAHEVVQLFAGVRADDEMANFRGEWVKASTKEVVTPAEITKTGVREVISGLEANFWDWWAAYGRDGLLRPTNQRKRWKRLRYLATIADQAEADRLAAGSIDSILGEPGMAAALKAWPWNARRRTFCTYHVAKHQSAARTALILRHRGAAETLHSSYRGLGVTLIQGKAFFAILPAPVTRPILPIPSSVSDCVRGRWLAGAVPAKADKEKAAAR